MADEISTLKMGGSLYYDAVLTSQAVAHPSVLIHALLVIGFLSLGMCSLEWSTLMPAPFHTCWPSIQPIYFDHAECEGRQMIPDVKTGTEIEEIEPCLGEHWSVVTLPGAVLLVVRVVLVLVAGVTVDVYGRRMSCIVWLGMFCLMAFSRSFSPNEAGSAVMMTLETASAQAAAIAMSLIALENSTKKECVRSLCLVLFGHALGVAIGAPLTLVYINKFLFRQMARSLPACIFIVFMKALPESGRWYVAMGKVCYAMGSIKNTHRIKVDPLVNQKLRKLREEIHSSAEVYGCASMTTEVRKHLREVVLPLLKVPVLFRVAFLLSLIAIAFGMCVQVRLLLEPATYANVGDRLVGSGASEVIVLTLVALVFGRTASSRGLLVSNVLLGVGVLIAPALSSAGVESCAAGILISIVGHGTAVLMWVWLIVGSASLTPTRSRGTMMGLVLALGTLSHNTTGLLLQEMKWLGEDTHPHTVAAVWTAVALAAGILAFLLPATPGNLPDAISHLQGTKRKTQEEESIAESTKL
ncbi:uncharacterized protein LOC143029838 [Oratosquilla oratoria]|uniref:uncharacterized protein LOC143029838 n=1 Tax=Oratosquilla oratoria TaxID=337810 RepID=UPI003F75E00E